jgi:tetratricopeptide (TPR) repeat protein
LLILALVLLPVAAGAQEWRGMGRIAGKVVDDSGKPIADVTVKAMLPSAGNQGPQSKSNARGDWTVAGVSRGEWALDFIKEGYETKSVSVSLAEGQRIPAMEIVMTKAAVVADPNVEIKEKLTEASRLMNAKQFAQARAIYEELSTRYPQVTQFRPLIARTYYGEGDKARAIEHLRAAAEKDPENVEVKLLLGNILIEVGKQEEGQQVLASVDESKVKDPTVYLNVGIAMINEGKHADAVTWFEKAIARFPGHADAYYYRGISKLSLGDRPAAKADLEKFLSLAPPDAPEIKMAKQILEGIR